MTKYYIKLFKISVFKGGKLDFNLNDIIYMCYMIHMSLAMWLASLIENLLSNY